MNLYNSRGVTHHVYVIVKFYLFKQKTAYEMRISDWSSDVFSSDLTKSFASISAKCRASCSLPQPAKRRIARMKVRGTRHRPYTWHLVTIPNRVAFSTMTKIRYHTT